VSTLVLAAETLVLLGGLVVLAGNALVLRFGLFAALLQPFDLAGTSVTADALHPSASTPVSSVRSQWTIENWVRVVRDTAVPRGHLQDPHRSKNGRNLAESGGGGGHGRASRLGCSCGDTGGRRGWLWRLLPEYTDRAESLSCRQRYSYEDR
jgi:hypothetical protein